MHRKLNGYKTNINNFLHTCDQTIAYWTFLLNPSVRMRFRKNITSSIVKKVYFVSLFLSWFKRFLKSLKQIWSYFLLFHIQKQGNRITKTGLMFQVELVIKFERFVANECIIL